MIKPIVEEREEIAKLVEAWFLPWQTHGEDNGLSALAAEIRARTCLEQGHTRTDSVTVVGKQNVYVCSYCKQELYAPIAV